MRVADLAHIAYGATLGFAADLLLAPCCTLGRLFGVETPLPARFWPGLAAGSPAKERGEVRLDGPMSGLRPGECAPPTDCVGRERRKEKGCAVDSERPRRRRETLGVMALERRFCCACMALMLARCMRCGGCVGTDGRRRSSGRAGVGISRTELGGERTERDR